MSRLYGPGPREPDPLKPVSDLAGTPVDDVHGRPAGELYGALADARHGLLRYLDLALYDSGQHVLVPIGHLRFEDHVGRLRGRLQAASRDELQKIEPYDPTEPPDETSEAALLASYGALFHGERYYAHPAYDHSRIFLGETPIITDESVRGEVDHGPLAHLSELADYRVAPGEPDIRGWSLRTRDGDSRSEISDLIVDPVAGKVRYVVLARPAREEGTLLPIGFLRIEEDAKEVIAPALTAEDLDALPPLPPGPLTREHELLVRHTLDQRLEGERRFERPDFVTWPHPRDR
jgi:photosynthetic reaction center H subunit